MGSRRSVRCVLLGLVIATTGLVAPSTGAGAAAPAAGRLSGRVQDAATGAALSSADIVLSDPTTHAPVARTSSDPGGTYSVPVLQGHYDVSVNTTGGAAKQGLMKDVAVKGDSRLLIALVAPADAPAPTVTLDGTLRDRNGAPIPSVTVILYSQATDYVHTTTGANGAFSARVPAGRYLLDLTRFAATPGAAVPQMSIDVSVPDVDLSRDRHLDLVLPAVDMTVTLHNRSGGPVANAFITTYGGLNNGAQDRTFTISPGISAVARWTGNGQTDSSGRVVLPGFPTDNVTFSVSPPGTPAFGSPGHTLAGNAVFDLTLPATATMRGVVHDYDGSPLPGVTVALTNNDPYGTFTAFGSAIAAADGSYSLTVPQGPYNLSIGRSFSPDGKGRDDTYGVGLANFDLLADRVQDLTVPGRIVAVHVTDPSGAPVAGASVMGSDTIFNIPVVIFAGGTGTGWHNSRRTTDSAGNAELLVLPNSDTNVTAQPPSGSTLAAAVPQVVASNRPGTATMVLRSTVTLAGHATLGAPIAGVSVHLDDASGSFDATTAADGSYNLRVPPGAYNFSLSACCPGASHPTERPDMVSLSGASLNMTANRTLDLDPGMAQVTARIYDAAGAAESLGLASYSAYGSNANVSLAPGLAAQSIYSTGNAKASGSTQVSFAVLSGADWSTGFSWPDQSGTVDRIVSATGLRFSADSDLALVQTKPVSSTPLPPDTTTTTTTGPSTNPSDGGAVTSGSGGGTTDPASSRSGYWMVTADGEVHAFGDAKHLGDPHGKLGSARAVRLAPTPDGNGYWILDDTGRVRAYGSAATFGDATTASLSPGEKAASLSATPTGKGYWIFTSRGRALTFGDAAFYGDMSKAKLNGPVLGSVATPSGKGYYMVASDGGIFTFGDAAFHGSTGNLHLNKPVMGMAPAPGGGYWLVASDGGIFAFDVPFHGSMGGARLNKPISGMVPGRDGYMMVAEDGGIFSFGDVAFHGSLGTHPPASPVVSAALLP